MCGSCRRKLKAEALRGQRYSGGHVMVRLGPFGPPIMAVRGAVPVVAPPNRCITCGGDAGASRYAAQPVCECCLVSIPMHVLNDSVRRLQANGHPERCGCQRCFGEGKATWSPGACPECGGLISEQGGCTSCMYTGGGPPPARAAGLVSQFSGHLMGVGPIATGPVLRSASHIPVGTMGIFAIFAKRGGAMPEQEPFSMEEPDADRAPDLIEPVLAWRGWNITPDGHLVAAATDGIWDAGPNHAVCRGGPNHTDVPAEGCVCGFYGWHETKDIAHGQLWGGIKCWGEVIVHDCGVRAEYAEIIVLLEPPGVAEPIPAELLARVVDRYKVPVVSTLAEAEKVAEGEGILMPEHLRPEDTRTSIKDVGAMLGKLTSQGMSPQEAAAAVQAAGAGSSVSAAAAMQQFSTSMAMASGSVATSLGAFSCQIAELGRQLERPRPLVKWIIAVALAVILDVGFTEEGRFGWPTWSALPWGIGVGLLVFWTPLVEKIWRGWRWMRRENVFELALLALCVLAGSLGLGVCVYLVWGLLSLVGVHPPPGVTDR